MKKSLVILFILSLTTLIGFSAQENTFEDKSIIMNTQDMSDEELRRAVEQLFQIEEDLKDPVSGSEPLAADAQGDKDLTLSSNDQGASVKESSDAK